MSKNTNTKNNKSAGEEFAKDTRRSKKGKGKSNPRNNRSQSSNDGQGSTVYYNHPSYYDRNPELTKSAGDFSFYPRLGIDYNATKSANIVSSKPQCYVTGTYQEPTLVVMHYVPTIGVSKDSTSPINILGQQIMSNIRAHISGTRKYQASDVVMHILKISAVYQALEMGKRAYLFSRSYTNFNLTSPTLLLEAMGFDADDMLEEYGLDKFYGRLVELSLSMAKFHIPDFINIVHQIGRAHV